MLYHFNEFSIPLDLSTFNILKTVVTPTFQSFTILFMFWFYIIIFRMNSIFCLHIILQHLMSADAQY